MRGGIVILSVLRAGVVLSETALLYVSRPAGFGVRLWYARYANGEVLCVSQVCVESWELCRL